MRLAMANAEVGDDVYGEDPTVRSSRRRVAELLGTEAALFVPTGTMANQIALRAQTKPGDEVIIGRGAHCWRHESGALAALAGAQTQVVGDDGMFTAADVRAAFKAEDPYQAPTRVVAVENTHNMAGGTCWDRAQLAEVVARRAPARHGRAPRRRADVERGGRDRRRPRSELAAGFDSVSVCLSKGLGAPAGSVVAGTRALHQGVPPVPQDVRRRHAPGGHPRGRRPVRARPPPRAARRRSREREGARRGARRRAGHPASTSTQVQTNIVMIDLERGTARAVDRARARRRRPARRRGRAARPRGHPPRRRSRRRDARRAGHRGDRREAVMRALAVLALVASLRAARRRRRCPSS